MKQHLLMMVLGITVSSACTAQETTLKGFLGVQGGESYTYKLVFTDSAGYLAGHSYTYLYETKEVKARITGFIDRTQKTLSFREHEIVYNNGFESGTTICLINAILKYKRNDDGREIYTGSITSSDVSNVYCGQGTVSFPYTEALTKILSTPPAEVPKPQPAAPANRDPLKVIYDTASMAAKPAPSGHTRPQDPEKITQGTEKMIEWKTDLLVIELWDGGQVDGDRISVSFGEKSILSNYQIEKQHKRIEIPVPQGITELIFTANHEGNQPPMTANVWLIDGEKKHELLVYNSIGKQAKVKIKR